MRENFSFDQKNIVITGASSGIGRATAILMSELGATIIALGRDEEKLDETKKYLAGKGHTTIAVDLQKSDSLSIIENEVAVFDCIHSFIHCAGIQIVKPWHLTSESDWDQSLNINVRASVEITKILRKKIIKSENGSIVFLASVMGLVSESGLASYSATKGAVIALTKALALELARVKIRVNCIAPGVVETPMIDKLRKTLTDDAFKSVCDSHPLGLGQPEDIAKAIAYLVSDASRWVTGSCLTIDGGYTSR